MVRIKQVIPHGGCHLEVRLENGNSMIVDFSKSLNTVRFGMLADEDFFRNAETDGVMIHWEHKIEISYSELFQIMQK